MKIPILNNKEPDCLSNLSKCNAGCCRVVMFNIENSNGEVRNVLNLRLLAPDQKYYYEIHGLIVKQLRDRTWQITIPPEIFKNVTTTFNYGSKGNLLMKIPSVCQELTSENKCGLHGSPKKPSHCRNLTQETADRYHITEGCIFE